MLFSACPCTAALICTYSTSTFLHIASKTHPLVSRHTHMSLHPFPCMNLKTRVSHAHYCIGKKRNAYISTPISPHVSLYTTPTFPYMESKAQHSHMYLAMTTYPQFSICVQCHAHISIYGHTHKF